MGYGPASSLRLETRAWTKRSLFAASLIAAMRLNREEIKSSPIVYAKIADSIRLAEMIQAVLLLALFSIFNSSARNRDRGSA
jgi:amino acid permease